MRFLKDREDLLLLGRGDYTVLDEDDFGVPGLVAREIIGPFVRLMASGPLIMVHDGVFQPRHGIGHHPHRNNERLFYILEGAVDHDDAQNNIQGHMDTGDLGRLTEGVAGMLHKEWNNTPGRARAFILVYRTTTRVPSASFALLKDQDAPRYQEGPGVSTKEMVGPKARFPINGDIRLFTDTTLEAGAGLTQELAPGEGALLFPVQGALALEGGEALGPGDALVAAPADAPRAIRVTSAPGARVLRVVYGQGHGLVLREQVGTAGLRRGRRA